MHRYTWILITLVLSLTFPLVVCTNGHSAPKILDIVSIGNQDVQYQAYEWMVQEVNKRSNGSLQLRHHAATLITKEAEAIDAAKAGNIAITTPVGAAPSLFPEMGVFMVPYLVQDYTHAYKILNGEIGKQLADLMERKYKLRPLYFYDYGFRHFWNAKRPINTPADLKGLKLRVQQGKVYTDTVNGLGASAVPMGWNEVIPACQQGVVDGGDLPVANIFYLKAYEVSKYASLTYHTYSPTVTVINPDIWKGLSPEHQKLLQEVGMGAQKFMRDKIESVDSLAGAKKLLEPVGMTVNAPDLAPFRALAEKNVWPQYKKQYPEMWEKIVNTK
jgi:tripartite ATP-independent transporter DctP family solute receptor